MGKTSSLNLSQGEKALVYGGVRVWDCQTGFHLRPQQASHRGWEEGEARAMGRSLPLENALRSELASQVHRGRNLASVPWSPEAWAPP